jgi:hypothetical protein
MSRSVQSRKLVTLKPFPVSVNPIGPSETRQWFVLGVSPRAPHTDLKLQALFRLAKWGCVSPLRADYIPLCCSNDSAAERLRQHPKTQHEIGFCPSVTF